MAPRKRKPSEYPKETRGSKLSAEIRKKTNSLRDEEREGLFKRGMQVIYGAPPKTTRARH
jgi:hypothetical protein